MEPFLLVSNLLVTRHKLVSELKEEELKKVTKQAIKEWLDEQFIIFGKWSLVSLFAAGLAALTYFILWSNGWHKG